MLHLKDRLRSWVKVWIKVSLKRLGKGERKIASVFGVNAAAAHEAVLHLRRGAPDVPIWLFTTAEPFPDTAALCECVYRDRNALPLVVDAQRRLWPYWSAISLSTWTGQRGAWALKLAPFLISPFRVLILNRDGGFFSGTPSNIFIHVMRAAREGIHNLRVRAVEATVEARDRVQWAIHPTRVRTGNLSRGFSKLSAATGLRVASVLLRWIADPHVALFRHLHGKRPLILDVEASSPDGVLHFRQSGQDWNGEALEKAAQASDARWVLWQSGSESDAIADGRILFGDSRTFAASRQAYFRGWRKMVVATAPFRELQMGEAARVLAPLSRSILVDRKKLLALGIPRCSMAGVAWLILFWKAAAAGWRSFSVGPAHSGLLEQPEFPIQDAAFVLRTLSTPALRRLCPRQEDLSRGNIGFRTADFGRTKNWNSDRLQVLIVSPFLPYPLSHGGAVRIYNLCRELSSRVDFTLIAMREAKDVVEYDKLGEVFREVYVVDRDQKARGDNKLPEQVSAGESSSLRALITQLSERLLPDLMQIEFTHFAGFRDSAPGVPAILVEHDLTFSLYRQLAESNGKAESWREYERWLAFERKWLHAYEAVWTVSEQDRLRAIEEGRRAADRTFAVANGVDLTRFRPTETSSAETREVLYVGSFRHLPNVIGFERLCDEIMPRVWAQAPETRLRVVAGPDHEQYWRHMGRRTDLSRLDPRIAVHGFVEDLRPFYERASVVAIPLEVSAGTNIKVLEAMACGKAIVSTPVGCAGLDLRDGYEIMIRKDWGEFSDALCRILSTPALRASLGMRAHWSAEKYFSWSGIAEQAYESYVTVAGTARRKAIADRSMNVA